MSDSLEGGGWISKLAMAAASAALIGGGGTVLSLHRNDAVQDERISRNTAAIEKSLDKVEALDPKLDEAIRKVDTLNARLDMEEKYRDARD